MDAKMSENGIIDFMVKGGPYGRHVRYFSVSITVI
jgi:hypothetical protein